MSTDRGTFGHSNSDGYDVYCLSVSCYLTNIYYLGSMFYGDKTQIVARLISTVAIVLLASTAVCSESSFGKTASVGVERGHFVFHFDNPSYIESASVQLEQTRSRLIIFLGDSLDYKPDVYLVDDANHFNRLIRGRFPDWGAAAAIPTRRMIVIKSPDEFNIQKPLKELLAHEYSHLVVAHVTGFHSPPRWFDEGMAMMVSMEWGWSDNLSMSKAAVFGQIPSLKSIDQVNRFSESAAHAAYATSYLCVSYLFEEYGPEAVATFLEHVRDGASLDLALRQSTGSDFRGFESEFRLHLGNRYNLVSLFMETMFFWLGMAILVIVGALLKYKKKRAYYRKWEEEERLHSTDFDYGNSDNPEQIDDEDEPWRS